MDLTSARKLSGYKLAQWRGRFRETLWAHTDFLIKTVEGQYVDENKKPKFDIVELVVLTLLCINMIVLGIFDPMNPESLRSQVAQWSDLSLSILFFLEALLRFIAFGRVVFIADKFNIVDLLVVVLSLVASILEAAGISFGNFTILRTVRVFRPLRTVTTLPALKTLVLSIYSAVKSLRDVTVLYLLFVISFSIIGVTQFMGRLRTRCVRNEWFNFSDRVFPFSAGVPLQGQIGNSTQFLALYPYTVNYTLPDFVCGGTFEKVTPNLSTSIGCGVEDTCNPAQFLGDRLLQGYTCPFGYSCIDVANPMFGFVAFDSVPQAMLTIFVGVTTEGLYRVAFQMMDAFDVTAAYFFVAIHVLGAFFIVNLTVVLVTVTFEHVSSRMKETQPKLVSKMQLKLQEGPRVLRTSRGKSFAMPRKSAARVVVDADGNEVLEENAYLIPNFDDGASSANNNEAGGGPVTVAALRSSARRLTSLTDVAEAALQIKEAEEAEKRQKDFEEARVKQAAKMERRKQRRLMREHFKKLHNGAEPPPSAGMDDTSSEDKSSSSDEEEVEVEEMNPMTLKTVMRKVMRKKRRKSGDAGGEDGKDEWGNAMDNNEAIKPMRAFIQKMVSKEGFENGLNMLIIINIGIMCTNHYGSSQLLQNFFIYSNIFFACVFGLEFIVKVLHWGPKRYFATPINVFDFVVLVLAIVDVSVAGDFPSVTALRVVRLLKVMKTFPGILRWTVVILISVKSSFLLLCTIFVVNYCFSMFGMHMLGGRFCNLGAADVDVRLDNTNPNCPNRPRSNFDDVVTAMLTTFNIMTGDTWDIVLYTSMRAVSPVVALAFIAYVALTQYVLINILVGILLSGPSPGEVDLIGVKLFGVSIAEAQKLDDEQEKKRREETEMALLEWQEGMNDANKKGKASALLKIDIKALAEKSMTMVPRKFLDSLEMVEDTLLDLPGGERHKNWKRNVRNTLQSRLVENIMLLLLSVSSLALAFETPEDAPDTPSAIILKMLDIMFSLLFAVEIALNFYAYGAVKEKDSYLRRDPWNVLDAVLVFTNLLGTSAYFYFQARWLKILLTVRAVRPLRFVKRSQGLRTVFTAFAMSAVPLKDVIFLATIIWTCWGLMGVQLFMGSFYSCTNSTLTTKSACLAGANVTTATFSNGSTATVFTPTKNQWVNAQLHFDHLGASFLSLLTLASLDGGVDIMVNGMDSVGPDIAPQVNNRQRVSLFFVSFVFIGGYFLVNLIVSVIIDTYNKEKARSGDSGIFLTSSQNAFLRSHRRILHGVPQIFYDDKNVSELKRNMRQIVSKPWFRHMATCASLINGCLLLVDYYGAPQELRTSILVANFTFALVFAAEVFVKSISLGAKRFFNSRFNCFDVFVTLCVFVGVLGEAAFPARGFTFVFRAMRSISLFRVVRNAARLRHVISRFSYSLYGLANVGALLFIFLYIFGVMGVKSFGLVQFGGSISRQVNFKNVFRAILLLLNALSGGGWASLMSDCAVQEPLCSDHINSCGVFGWSQAYFVIFILFTKFVLLNMFIAVILDSFVSTDYEQLSISKDHVRQFFEHWMFIDPSMTLRIDSRQLVPFLRSLAPDNPLGFGGTELTRKIGHEFKFIQQLKLHEMEGTIELQDLITALCDATLGVPLPDSEIRSLQQYADRKFHRKERDLYIGGKNLLNGDRAKEAQSRVIDRFAVHVIEQHWMAFKARIGKRRGRIGQASALRSRAGDAAAMSRRDNMSYIDEKMSFWQGTGDRDETESEDTEDEENGGGGGGGGTASMDGDGRSGRSIRIVLKEKQEAKRKARAERKEQERLRREDPIESRPALKKYLHEIAAPLLAAKRLAQRDKAPGAANILRRTAEEDAASLVESEALKRMLVPKFQVAWHDAGQQLLDETLKNKMPLGGSRLLHAERVLEQVHNDRKAQELQAAEAAFTAATLQHRRGEHSKNINNNNNNNDDDDDDDFEVRASSNDPVQMSLEQQIKYDAEMAQRFGLLSATKVWSRESRQTEEERQRQSLAMSPVSRAYEAKKNPAISIPGTFASAGYSHSQAKQTAARPAAHGGSAVHPGRRALAPMIAPTKIAGDTNDTSPPRVTLVFDDGPFITGWGGAEKEEQRRLQREQEAEAQCNHHHDLDAELLQRMVPPAAVRATMNNVPLRHSPSAHNRSVSFAPPSASPSSSAAVAAVVVDSGSATAVDGGTPAISRTLSKKPLAPDDDVEMMILLQEIKAWRGEAVPADQKVVRPPGYNSLYTAADYKAL